MRPLFLLIFVVGCEALSAAPPDLADKVRDAHDRMHQRFDASRRMQQAIALGRLERAHDEAKLVDFLEEPDALPEWREYIDRVRASARSVVATKNLGDAARATGRLGRECARCHEAGKTRIVFAKLSPPPEDPRLAPQMASHAWAAERMWEGLIGPDDARWQLGARRLAAAKVGITAEDGSLGIADDVSRMHLFARRALVPQSQTDRAQLYGELLATCAHCHAVIRD
jgi:cytochrome c553